jgi:hypothetical protein
LQKATSLVIPTVHTRNILTRIVAKSHSFGHSYSTRNILTRRIAKSHTFGLSYSTINILTRIVAK